MRRPLAFRAGGKDSSSVRRGGRRAASFRTASLGAAASRKSCRRLGAVLGCAACLPRVLGVQTSRCRQLLQPDPRAQQPAGAGPCCPSGRGPAAPGLRCPLPAAWRRGRGGGRPAARPRADAAAHSRGARVGPVSAPVGLPVAAASSQSRGRTEAVGGSGSRGRGPRLRPSHLSREGVAPATFLPPRAPAPGGSEHGVAVTPGHSAQVSAGAAQHGVPDGQNER